MDFQNIADMFLVNKNNHRPMAKGDAGHMKKYVSAYEQGTYLMLEFEKVDSVTGDLSLVDDDITVIMPSDQITGRPYDLRYRAQKLEDVYCVKVTSIDSAKKIVEAATKHGAKKVVGPVPLPTEKQVVTILRAVHKYKDSREQFEMRTHKRLIEIVAPTKETMDSLQRLELPSGVDIEIKL